MKTLKTSKIFLIAVLFSVGLVGCTIDKGDIERCAKVCEPNGGIDHINPAIPGGSTHCYCANKAYFALK